ncbi:MAG: nucleoside 2-deoxyribosyltransferase [Candidatus Freyarchaeota archaeon]|nr:nucleoside 2-deoxyribosyltransferase [Candidatus Jordarchaeia archaeon]MBS7270276.1 nucleoside 2-deoxyribosyltransferase [Candidatus Jordarchaeia archaeon]MBS7281013.1 nucleoside 2-deoxyribosyltransferase [Candidatus Jordarchaeia archaeon]
MQIYLAAPLFSEAERDFNRKVARKLREAGFDVWLPQESLLVKEGTLEEKRRIYEADIKALRECDVVVAVLDGVDVDSGVAFEIGYVVALGKPVVGLKTDHRIFSRVEDINLILEIPLRATCKTVSEVIEALKKFEDVSTRPPLQDALGQKS